MTDQPMTYPEKLRAMAAQFEHYEKTLGRAYALSKMRDLLNLTSNEALQEMQRMREKTDG